MASACTVALGLPSAREACQVHTCKEPLPSCWPDGILAEHWEIVCTGPTEARGDPDHFPPLFSGDGVQVLPPNSPSHFYSTLQKAECFPRNPLLFQLSEGSWVGIESPFFQKGKLRLRAVRESPKAAQLAGGRLESGSFPLLRCLCVLSLHHQAAHGWGWPWGWPRARQLPQALPQGHSGR